MKLVAVVSIYGRELDPQRLQTLVGMPSFLRRFMDFQSSGRNMPGFSLLSVADMPALSLVTRLWETFRHSDPSQDKSMHVSALQR